MAKAFYKIWIIRFGVPQKVTTDQGRQFKSALFIHRIRRSPYHPQAYELIENSAALKSYLIYTSERWVDVLSTVLFGMRDSNGPDLK